MTSIPRAVGATSVPRRSHLSAVDVAPSPSPPISEAKQRFIAAEAQGHAWGGITEASAGLEHLESARQIDALGDTVMEQIEEMVEDAWCAFVEGRVSALAGLLQALKTAIATYKHLDRQEQAHWDRQAPGRVRNAREEGVATSQILDRLLAND